MSTGVSRLWTPSWLRTAQYPRALEGIAKPYVEDAPMLQCSKRRRPPRSKSTVAVGLSAASACHAVAGRRRKLCEGGWATGFGQVPVSRPRNERAT